MVPNLFTSLPHIRAGKLRALGVTTAKRVDALPEVPAIAESVPDQSTLEVLRACGVDYAQGYHVGRPCALDELRLAAPASS